METTVYIIGHKNPDTDSAVAATAYAKLKHLQGHTEYVAARAGHFTPQTDYIFKKFGVPFPKYIPELIPKVQYYMTDKVETVMQYESVWEAVKKLEASNKRILPVVDKDGKYVSLMHYNVFAQDVLRVLNPEHKASISTSISLIIKTMDAQPIVVKNENEIFKAYVVMGSTSVDSFKQTLDERSGGDVIVIAADREEIHEAAIDAKVRLLILVRGFVLPKKLREKAEANGVSVISSPYATTSTSMLIPYSTPVSLMADSTIEAVHPEDTVSKVRPMLRNLPCRSLPVVDENSHVIGSISEYSLLGEPNIELVLVDHNEVTQSVDGSENYKIREVIDHHRLGMASTKYPILFINKPVGSTATLITGLYRESHVSIPKEIASLLLCGILTDTLVLKSTTTTDTDRETAQYLSDITGLDVESLGKEIIAAGSRTKGRKTVEIINQDMKEYTQDKIHYTVSQIEVGDPDEILSRKKEFIDELEVVRRTNKALFSALLVTDISTLSSMLLMAYEPKFAPFITFPKQEENVYYLKDVVSRKKQLVPLVTELIDNYLK